MASNLEAVAAVGIPQESRGSQDDANGNVVSVAVGAFADHCADGMQNVDEGGVDCGGADCAACPAPLRAFITSTSTYTGNLGGAVGADAICQGRANTAGLGGTWQAWVSDLGSTPPTRWATQSATGYALLDGTVVANNFADMTDGNGIAAPINRDEFNMAVAFDNVWTGTTETGTLDVVHCLGFTDGSGGESSRVGANNQSGVLWTDAGPTVCSTTNRIYCFEQ